MSQKERAFSEGDISLGTFAASGKKRVGEGGGRRRTRKGKEEEKGEKEEK